MNYPYDLHSWSAQYRQEVLHEVRMKQIEGRLRENHKARSGPGHRTGSEARQAAESARLPKAHQGLPGRGGER